MEQRVTISTLDKMKAADVRSLCCITAYDATFARLISEAGAETILVGDSLGMVLQGHDSTIPVTGFDDMAYHTACVCRAVVLTRLVVADLPFHELRPLHRKLWSLPVAHVADAGGRPDGQDGGRYVWLCPTAFSHAG